MKKIIHLTIYLYTDVLEYVDKQNRSHKIFQSLFFPQKKNIYIL